MWNIEAFGGMSGIRCDFAWKGSSRLSAEVAGPAPKPSDAEPSPEVVAASPPEVGKRVFLESLASLK